jgi:catechol-2,3-dioxygenase
MWFLKACFLFNFPEAVLLKRFAAPELDFIFGMTVIFIAKIRSAKLSKFVLKERVPMQFHEIFFYTSQLQANRQFYCDLLGFEELSSSPVAFSFRAGKSIIHFAEKEAITIYHFAFNIPENQRFEALSWIKERCSILPAGDDEIIDFANWNAHAIYFKDAAGNILEFIARHDLSNASDASFSIQNVLEVSEIGLVSPDAPAAYTQIGGELGIEPYRQHSERFAAMGDEHALFIVVPDDRNWYPTEIPSRVADFQVKGTVNGENFSVDYSNGQLEVQI